MRGKRYHLADIVMTPGAMLLRAPMPDVLFWYPIQLLRSITKIFLKRRPLVAMRGLFGAVCWFPIFLMERRSISRGEFSRWLRTRKEYMSRIKKENDLLVG